MGFKQSVSDQELRAVAGTVLGDGVQVEAVEELREGTFNSAHALTLTDGRRLVLKVAPAADTPILTYEHGLLHTEALCLRTFGNQTTVPLPTLVAVDTSGDVIGRDWLLMSRIPGSSWASQAPHITGDRRRELRRQLGAHVAALHQVTGDRFGYPAPGSSLHAPTWTLAYQRIIDALLSDADRFQVELPMPPDEIRGRLHEAAEALLPTVDTPVLVHFDLWEGNIFVAGRSGSPRVTGLIDHERALWADPAADFVSLALFDDIGRDHDFLTGYTEAGGPVSLDEATRARLHLYQAHLALIMIVEMVPRRAMGPNIPAQQASLSRWLMSELSALPG